MKQVIKQIKTNPNQVQQNQSTSLPQKVLKNKIIKRMQQISCQLKIYPYKKKFHSLTQNNVFYFDINKIINDKNINCIAKLCSTFFQFLVLRMISYYYDLAFPNKFSNKQNRTGSQNKLGRNTVKKLTSVQDSNYGSHFRQNKMRANTTVTFTQKSINNQIRQSLSKIKSNKKLGTIKKIQTQKSVKNRQFNETRASEQQEISYRLLEVNQQIKQAYFQLTQNLNNKYRVAKLEIICFLIVFIAPDILRPYLNTIQKQFNQFTHINNVNLQLLTNQKSVQPNNNQFLGVQQQVHIVLTYQTIGNLVSPNSFRCLKKKYLKYEIFVCPDAEQSIKLMQSLKHIKQKLRSQKNVVLIKGRRHRQKQTRKIKKLKSLKLQEEQMFSKQKMKQFIKQALRTKQNTDIKKSLSNYGGEENNNNSQDKFQETFYPIFKNSNFNTPKLALSKQIQSHKKSVSINSKLNLQNFKQNKKYQDIKRKKYVTNTQKSFFKFKTNFQRKKEISNFPKSQRSSYKFNRINCQSTPPTMIAPGIVKSEYQRQPIQQMKIKIQAFKCQALKDHQIIESFKQSISLKQIKRDFVFSQDRKHKQSSLIKLEDLTKIKQLTNKESKYLQKSRQTGKKIDSRISIKQKQQVWHQMYNIRFEPPIQISKQVQIPRVSYRLSKNSDLLRKNRKVFEQDCKKRIQYLEDDIDLVSRMKMGIR